MNWESYFAELEAQFADDLAAEQNAIDRENERLRHARLDLASRLRALAADNAATMITTVGQHQVHGTVRAVGADWCAVEGEPGLVRYVRFDAIRSLLVSRDAVRRSLLPVPADALTGRATFGYVLRGWARRRIPVLVQFADSSVLNGTIDRAGSDHCDIAPDDGRSDGDGVSRVILVPFLALDLVSPLAGGTTAVG